MQHACVLSIDRSVVVIEEGWHGVTEEGIKRERESNVEWLYWMTDTSPGDLLPYRSSSHEVG